MTLLHRLRLPRHLRPRRWSILAIVDLERLDIRIHRFPVLVLVIGPWLNQSVALVLVPFLAGFLLGAPLVDGGTGFAVALVAYDAAHCWCGFRRKYGMCLLLYRY